MANRAETFVLESIESRIMSDDSKEKHLTQYWSNLKLKLDKAKEILPPITAIEVKIVSPILHVDGRISFAFSSFSFKFDQY